MEDTLIFVVWKGEAECGTLLTGKRDANKERKDIKYDSGKRRNVFRTSLWLELSTH